MLQREDEIHDESQQGRRQTDGQGVDDEIARRRAAWRQPAPRYTKGVLAKFAKLASTASKGAITDEKLF